MRDNTEEGESIVMEKMRSAHSNERRRHTFHGERQPNTHLVSGMESGLLSTNKEREKNIFNHMTSYK
jgi:hypothetical protein